MQYNSSFRNFLKTTPLHVYLAVIPVMLLILLGLLNLWDFVPIQIYVYRHFDSIDPLFMLKYQVLWVVLGVCALFLVKYSYHRFQQYCWIFALLVPLLLVLAFVPHVGLHLNGSCRHINFMGGTIHTGIWAVLLAVPALSAWITYVNRKDSPRFAALGMFVWIVLISGLLLAQVDLPMLALFNAVAISMIVVSKLKLHLKIIIVGLLLTLVLGGISFNLLNSPYRLQRVVSSYAYQASPYSFGYQTFMSVMDREAGGLTGQGFGSFTTEPMEPRRYVLPYTVTTFMLQITARQMGLCGIAFVVLLVALLAYAGRNLVLETQGGFDRMVKIGALMFLLWQAFFSIARTLNLLPLMPAHNIPFFGYGANAVIAAFVALGLLLYRKRDHQDLL